MATFVNPCQTEIKTTKPWGYSISNPIGDPQNVEADKIMIVMLGVVIIYFRGGGCVRVARA